LNTTYYTNIIILSLVPTAASAASSGYTVPSTGFWSTTGGNGQPTTTSAPTFT